jgi:hypothetical protein
MVRIYFEGDARLRVGLREFLKPEVELAATHKIKLDLVGAGKKQAEKACRVGQRDYPAARHLILKDAEGPIPAGRPKHTYYWVQAMESWFVADPAAIQKAFGPCVQLKVLPKWPNVETRPKADVLKYLSKVTKACGPSKCYDEKDHSPVLAGMILRQLDRRTVVKKSPECGHFLNTLRSTIHRLSAETL